MTVADGRYALDDVCVERPLWPDFVKVCGERPA
jgi:hypothetical protein